MNSMAYALFDPRNFGPEDSRHATFTRLREHSPVILGAPGVNVTERCYYVFTRELMEKALLHPALMHAPPGAYQEIRAILKQDPVRKIFLSGMLFADPPEHTRLRKPLQPMFSGSRLAALEEGMLTRLRALMGEARERGAFDAVDDIAVPFVIEFLFQVMGFPHADPHWLKEQSEIVAHGLDFSTEAFPGIGEALGNIVAYVEDAVSRPAPDGSVLAAMQEITARGDWSHDDLVASCVLFLNAGQETVIDAMGNAFLALEQNPTERRSLRGRPDLCAPAAEELLRFEPPVYFTGERVAASDVDLGTLKVAAGESVVCVLASANRDPAWIDRPDALDFTRQGVRRSMAFGTGLHTCIGQHLARLEMRTLLQVLYAESPEFGINESGVRHRPNIIYRGLTKAPATFA